jgi:LmbE family N-acetylglucosaminyl deacetylase
VRFWLNRRYLLGSVSLLIATGILGYQISPARSSASSNPGRSQPVEGSAGGDDVVRTRDLANPSVYDRGAAGLGQAIKRLGTIGSVLHTGAHPDDENSGLLAYLARGRQARTAYLSLTRGDGGQNLIGPEIYEALGVIRTDELLAARRLDGAHQFFTRAYDFGFSKSRAEALSKWDQEAVLSDMVRVIRTFRPLVIVSQWSGTPLDGHGHHQAAGYLTPEAYRAAADPARFPDQIAEGLRPWKTRKLYTGGFGRRQSSDTAGGAQLTINTGEYDPLLGRTYFEVAMQGRSRHRTQDQGALERKGPQFATLKLTDPSTGAGSDKDIFDGIDVSLSGIADFADEGSARLKPLLAEVQKDAESARESYKPFSPGDTSRVIADGLRRLREIRTALLEFGLSPAAVYDVDFLLRQKEQDFAEALARSQELVVECLADDEVVTPGQSFDVAITSYSKPDLSPGAVSLKLPDGWTAVQEKQTRNTRGGELIAETRFKVTVARDAQFTEPYWLENPRKGDMFVPGAGGTGIEPWSSPPVVADVEFAIDGQPIALVDRVQYRFADKALGEIRRDIKVAPKLSVGVSPGIVINPVSDAREHNVTVSVMSNDKLAERGSASIQAPAGWSVTPGEASFELRRPGERVSLAFVVKPPPGLREGRYELKAVAEAGGERFSTGYQVVSYPHTTPRFVYHSAAARVEAFDVRVAPGLNIGYIEGAGDDVEAALNQLGVKTTVIGQNELASGDLSRYDAIVTGIRVYEVRPDVASNNSRLLEYVKQGGTLIVQYNKDEYARGAFAPFAISMGWRTLHVGEGAQIVPGVSAMRPGVPVEVTGKLGPDGSVEAERIAMRAGGDLDAMPNTKEHFVGLVESVPGAEGLLGSWRVRRGPDRVTDETATVTILDPASPFFSYPNRITARDFEGWVQERGAYFLSEWDPHFKPLLECNDKGEDPQQGGELIAEYGRGAYIYTAYGWYRQLPAGVIGAYRLLANMVSYPKRPR